MGVTVTPTVGLVTTEVGGTAMFTVVLDAQPTADVTIALSSSDLTEGSVAPASLTFTPANWFTAQPATVTGVSDGVLDGDTGYTILTTATSTDTGYNGIAVADVSVSNSDDGEADLALSKTDGLTTVISGQTVTYTITGSNAGPAATTATVTDTFPAVCGTVSWTCTTGGGASCTGSGSGNLNDPVILPNGGSVTYTALCTVAGSASGSLVNTATITSSNDPNTGNNSATDTDSITCTYALTPPNQVVSASAGGQVMTVTTQSGCAWSATSAAPWLTLTGGSPGPGSGTVAYNVAANPGPNPRRGSLTIAGKLFIVSQRTPVPAPCTISASTSGSPIANSGGPGSVTITASTGSCRWSARSHVGWITLTGPVTGSSSGSVAFTVTENLGSPRKGRITVNGKRVVVAQD